MTGIALAAALLVSVAASAAAPVSVLPLAEVDYAPAKPFAEFHASLASTASAAFVGTPGGLFRLPLRVEEGAAELSGFPGASITRVYAEDGRLYVLKESTPTPNAATDHALLRSDDDGATFVGLDHPLFTCHAGSCQFMFGSEAIVRGGTIYYAAGGNVLVSGDGGSTWTALVGFLEPAMCYDPSIALVGERLLIGGECPLDIAYIRAGRLTPGGLAWSEEPAAVLTPELENRNIQFIERFGDSSLVYAGIEGALLRSWDEGASFEFVLHVPIEGHEKYPYIGSIWMSARAPGTILVGGFDKAVSEGGGWLALSRNYGRTWTDVSGALPRDGGFRPDSVSFLEEDAEGRVLAGVIDTAATKVRIVEVRIDDVRKRTVRR